MFTYNIMRLAGLKMSAFDADHPLLGRTHGAVAYVGLVLSVSHQVSIDSVTVESFKQA